MKYPVVFKWLSNGMGISLILDKDMDFESLKEEVAKKFRNSKGFFKNASIGINFEGKKLSEEEKLEIIDVIKQNSELTIVCIIDNDKKMEEKIQLKLNEAISTIEVMKEQALEQAKIEKEKLEKEQNEKEKNNKGEAGVFVKGTLRSGTELTYDSSVVIIGDVNVGAKIISTGNILVIGTLSGSAFAGSLGNKKSFVAALDMRSEQIRIADIIAMMPDEEPIKKGRKKKGNLSEGKIAYIENDEVKIKPISRDIFKEISKL